LLSFIIIYGKDESLLKLISEEAFSLVELILVIGIISSLILMVSPRINLNKYQIDKEAQAIYSVLHKTRYIAITESEDYLICLLAGNRLGIRKSTDSTFQEIIEIADNLFINCTRKDNQLKFTPLGTAVSGSFIISDGTYSKKVIVAGNGFIRIE